MGGLCNGASIVGAYYRAHLYDLCRACHLLEWDDGVARCQALDGREELMACPGLEEHVQHNEIPLYGMNKPRGQQKPKRKRQWK